MSATLASFLGGILGGMFAVLLFAWFALRHFIAGFIDRMRADAMETEALMRAASEIKSKWPDVVITLDGLDITTRASKRGIETN